MTIPIGRNFIDGVWLDTDDTVDDTDPGNGDVIGRLSRSGAEEVDVAVAAARRAAATATSTSSAPERDSRPITSPLPGSVSSTVSSVSSHTPSMKFRPIGMVIGYTSGIARSLG